MLWDYPFNLLWLCYETILNWLWLYRKTLPLIGYAIVVRQFTMQLFKEYLFNWLWICCNDDDIVWLSLYCRLSTYFSTWHPLYQAGRQEIYYSPVEPTIQNTENIFKTNSSVSVQHIPEQFIPGGVRKISFFLNTLLYRLPNSIEIIHM